MADAKFPEFVRSTEYRRELGLKRKRAIREMYSDIAAETEKKIRDIERAGKWSGTTVLQMKQLRDLQKSVEKSLKELGKSLEKDILSDMKKVAEVTCTDVAGFLRRSGAGISISMAHVPDKVVRNIVSGNLYGQRWTFSKAIWNDYNKASGDLAMIVSKGLAAQKPIYDIAKDLEKYLNPAVRKDYDWSRLYPGSKKQVDYNAYRLAQTMSTHAHQQAVIISCKEDPLVDGVEWRSSGSSRVCPLCEQRNGEIFPLDKCPMDHPMGQCILIPHIKKTGNDPHKNPPEDATEWKGAKVNGKEYTSVIGADGKPQKLAHPNSRFTAPAVNCPCVSPEFNNPKGVPVSAIIFGGRRESTTPLVYQAKDWTHGTYMGSAVSSETTAAATGAVGVLRHDPMAMKPFIGYNVGDYWAHWLEMGEKLGDKAPKIFNVNWFRKDAEGNFMWPGFGDNMRVLDWIIKRCEGSVDAKETAIGFLPNAEDINIDGLENEGKPMTVADIQALLDVDKDLWKKEIAGMREYYNDLKSKGAHIPEALYKKLDQIDADLG